MTNEEARFEELGNDFTDSVAGKLFGKPCFKIAGKAFMCFFQDCAVFKLPSAERAEALTKAGASLFDPSGKGRPMKEWVQVPFAHKADWERFAATAFEYVKSGEE